MVVVVVVVVVVHVVVVDPRNLPLKFGKNWVTNSLDISDMDKCFLDKFQLDSWNLF